MSKQITQHSHLLYLVLLLFLIVGCVLHINVGQHKGSQLADLHFRNNPGEPLASSSNLETVLVVKSLIKAGALLKPSMFRTVKSQVNRLSDDMVRSYDEVAGMFSTSNLKPGHLLSLDYVSYNRPVYFAERFVPIGYRAIELDFKAKVWPRAASRVNLLWQQSGTNGLKHVLANDVQIYSIGLSYSRQGTRKAVFIVKPAIANKLLLASQYGELHSSIETVSSY